MTGVQTCALPIWRRLKRFAIQISNDAEHDLDDIADWYADHHPGGHDRFRKDFNSCLDVLATFPNAGRERINRIGLRAYPVHPYLVWYRVDEHAKEVVVLSIMPGSIDMDPDEFD